MYYAVLHDSVLNSNDQMKGIGPHFPVVLLTMLYNVVLSTESVDEILKCSDH